MPEEEQPLPKKYVRVHRKQGYQIFGNNTAAYKPCFYWKSALTEQIFCYKYWFFGAPPSHRCVQWSPFIECNESCPFCWRTHRTDLGLRVFRRKDLEKINWPEPTLLMDTLLDVYKGTLKGYNPEYREQTVSELWRDAMENPPHLATSLTGEPLMYPYIGELMEIAKHRDMTTFIVSNGTFPERIERMGTLPTQFYLTLAGPDYRTWAQATNPLWNPRKQWEQLNESLELLPTLNTRTVVRITAIKNMNMRSPSKYARLIEKAEPNFISVKGYSHIGGARKRLNEENQPNMKQVEHFAGELSNETGWKIEEKVERGRAVLLWDEQRERMIEERKYPSAKR